MLVAKQVADLITFSRGMMALALAWLGIEAGSCRLKARTLHRPGLALGVPDNAGAEPDAWHSRDDRHQRKSPLVEIGRAHV